MASPPLHAQQCGIEFSRVATLGQLEDSASIQIPRNIWVAEVPWGGWLVAERDRRLLRYNPDGSLDGPFIRAGQGPGELVNAATVVVDPTDSTWISDYHGRALVLDPSGALGRTVVDPAMDYVHGFTPGGLPYTLGVTLLGGTATEPDLDPFVRVMNRAGGEITTFRPGPSGGQEFPSLSAPRIDATTDSTFRYPTPSEQVIQTWNGSVTSSFELSVVGRVADVEDIKPIDILPLGVFPAVGGGTWLAVKVRRMSREREQELVDAAPDVPGYGRSAASVRRYSPPIANEAWDGVFMHISPGGRVTASGVMDEYPYGFSGARQFVTASETEYGLIQIHIHDFDRVCR